MYPRVGRDRWRVHHAGGTELDGRDEGEEEKCGKELVGCGSEGVDYRAGDGLREGGKKNYIISRFLIFLFYHNARRTSGVASRSFDLSILPVFLLLYAW